PGNIGDDFRVYTETDNGDKVRAYRNGDDWYRADGTPVNGPQEIEDIRTGLVFPKYQDPNAHQANYIKSEDYNTDASFKDYEVQVNVMPRLAFSFPISEDANFFAHYDILVQRPNSNTIASALDYFYFTERTGQVTFNNPALRPERTVDYEVGFQQALSQTSAIKISAYYKEMRDMIQLRTFFPVPIVNSYTTYDNLDFGTVKAFSFAYDLRRTRNLQLNANYTLQFADGTGSNTESTRGLNNRGNIRNLFPLDFDERHRINLIADYRFGKDQGPRLAGAYIFANAGINLQAIAVSGRPYTAKQVPDQELQASGTVGSINGARKPWNTTLNLRIDKNFQFGKGLGLNVYLRVSNLLDTRNIINVYQVTGSPEDDGFLRSQFGQNRIRLIESSARDLNAYLASYQWRLLNSDFYSLPRRLFLGAIVNF
ncbi:MAG: TonB-dependent receptor, partial [Bacteroidetes bacterium]